MPRVMDDDDDDDYYYTRRPTFNRSRSPSPPPPPIREYVPPPSQHYRQQQQQQQQQQRASERSRHVPPGYSAPPAVQYVQRSKDQTRITLQSSSRVAPGSFAPNPFAPPAAAEDDWYDPYPSHADAIRRRRSEAPDIWYGDDHDRLEREAAREAERLRARREFEERERAEEGLRREREERELRRVREAREFELRRAAREQRQRQQEQVHRPRQFASRPGPYFDEFGMESDSDSAYSFQMNVREQLLGSGNITSGASDASSDPGTPGVAPSPLPASSSSSQFYSPTLRNVFNAQYTGDDFEGDIQASLEVDESSGSAPRKSPHSIYRWVHLQNPVLHFAAFIDDLGKSSYVMESEKADVKKLLDRVRNKFERTSPQGLKGKHMEPNFFQDTYVMSKAGSKRKESRKISFFCIPYLLLTAYAPPSLPDKSSAHPITTLLQSRYPSAPKARDLQQAVCRLGSAPKGSCFHVSQLWCLILGDSLLVTCARLPDKTLQGTSITTSLSVASVSLVVFSGDSQVWLLNAQECRSWFAFVSSFVEISSNFERDYEVLFRGIKVTKKDWPKIVNQCKRATVKLTIRLRARRVRDSDEESNELDSSDSAVGDDQVPAPRRSTPQTRRDGPNIRIYNSMDSPDRYGDRFERRPPRSPDSPPPPPPPPSGVRYVWMDKDHFDTDHGAHRAEFKPVKSYTMLDKNVVPTKSLEDAKETFEETPDGNLVSRRLTRSTVRRLAGPHASPKQLELYTVIDYLIVDLGGKRGLRFQRVYNGRAPCQDIVLYGVQIVETFRIGNKSWCVEILTPGTHIISYDGEGVYHQDLKIDGSPDQRSSDLVNKDIRNTSNLVYYRAASNERPTAIRVGRISQKLLELANHMAEYRKSPQHGRRRERNAPAPPEFTGNSRRGTQATSRSRPKTEAKGGRERDDGSRTYDRLQVPETKQTPSDKKKQKKKPSSPMEDKKHTFHILKWLTSSKSTGNPSGGTGNGSAPPTIIAAADDATDDEKLKLVLADVDDFLSEKGKLHERKLYIKCQENSAHVLEKEMKLLGKSAKSRNRSNKVKFVKKAQEGLDFFLPATSDATTMLKGVGGLLSLLNFAPYEDTFQDGWMHLLGALRKTMAEIETTLTDDGAPESALLSGSETAAHEITRAWLHYVMALVSLSTRPSGSFVRFHLIKCNDHLERSLVEIRKGVNFTSITEREAVMPLGIACLVISRLVGDITDDHPDVVTTYWAYLDRLDLEIRDDSLNRAHQEKLNHFQQEVEAVINVLDDQLRILRDLDYSITSGSETRFSAFLSRESRILTDCISRINMKLLSFKEMSDRAGGLGVWNLRAIESNKDRQESAILAFTIVTIIFLPLSFVSSIFGMNTTDIRDMGQAQWLYWAVAIPVTTVVIILTMYFAGELNRKVLSKWKFWQRQKVPSMPPLPPSYETVTTAVELPQYSKVLKRR